ncbi:MAG: BrnT family toxin [Desulfamplus sp.]|nr:BrnT family toxin [Desulfamplus sp.]
MFFEWDINKAKANKRKHGVTFEEGSSSLRDPLSATAYDPDHSEDEERYITFGVSSKGRLLTVSHTENNNVIRIISARLATKTERLIYEEG